MKYPKYSEKIEYVAKFSNPVNSLDQNSFLQVCRDMKVALNEVEKREVFTRLDYNNRKYITVKELDEFLKQASKKQKSV